MWSERATSSFPLPDSPAIVLQRAASPKPDGFESGAWWDARVQIDDHWTVQAGLRSVRPCLMTGAGTILGLIPVLTSTGRGSDIMVPMAIPSFGGMLIGLMTMLIVPVLYCWV